MITSSPERAIQSKSEDKLERTRFIERLAGAVVNPDTNKSTGVVIGISGSWGSGKSSLLNLLKEHLEHQYDDALVVRFDPWLVSGRNDLIAEFLGELIGTINADEARAAKFKSLSASIARYGAQLAPWGNVLLPGLGAILKGSFEAAQAALSKKSSLSALRARLIVELQKVTSPIVVLIDELDRVEDGEIRTIAQLVRSVFDFPSISYVLAYDAERVVQALGSGADKNDRLDRGRSYLEKIVQLQILLPVTFASEIIRLLGAEIGALATDLRLPEGFAEDRRFKELLELLAEDVVKTPRDIQRLVGTFHVLAGMLHDEVDWIDLLAYSALLTKAPATVAKMRRSPDRFSDELGSRRTIARMVSGKKASIEEQLKELIPPEELNDSTKGLLSYLLPSLSEVRQVTSDRRDAFYRRRPFLTTLRLGLLPGEYSREQVLNLFRQEPKIIKSRLEEAERTGTIGLLTDRIVDLYSELPLTSEIVFWRGVAAFAAKPDCEWLAAYNEMHQNIDNFASLMEEAVARDKTYRAHAVKIFSQLRSDGENELIAYWLRSHIFTFGLYGNAKQDTEKWFLDSSQTVALARELAGTWRTQHLSGKLIPCRWDLEPVFTMLDLGIWDEPCRDVLDRCLEVDRAVDGFTLLMYGGVHGVGRRFVGKMCNAEKYFERVNARINSGEKMHESVRAALEKAGRAPPN